MLFTRVLYAAIILTVLGICAIAVELSQIEERQHVEATAFFHKAVVYISELVPGQVYALGFALPLVLVPLAIIYLILFRII